MHPATLETLENARDIAGEYGGNLTLRQLYYQLVARGFIENSQRSYKRVGNILAQARLAGDFPFDWLLDRTRECRPGDFGTDSTSVYRALRSAGNELRTAPERWLWRSRWWGQPTHVSVWVEKEALSGVFEEPCDRLGVSWFVLRGYSSLSSLSQWVDTMDEAQSADPAIEEAVVLYFGDHDPDGWEIPRSAERNVDAIAEVRGIDLPPVTFERIALNRDQIDTYSPPPFPAKETSSRFKSYVREHRLNDAWELDALNPRTLISLIEGAVAPHFDREIAAENDEEVTRRQEEMRTAMLEPGWAAEALED